MILCAAIKFHIDKTDEDVILCGQRHGDIFKQLKLLGFEPKIGYKEIAQGFITHTGDFLDREDAWKHAAMCGQLTIVQQDNFDYGDTPKLVSEDLY